MTKRNIGLRGYLGEQIVRYWLENIRYIEEGYDIVEQILQVGYPKTGGPYLDFGITKDGVVEAVYEVKTQDCIAGKDFPFNGALLDIWNNRERIESFEYQEGKEKDILKVSPNFETFLILLVPPNERGIEKIKEKNLKYTLLFEEIFAEIPSKDLDACLKEILKKINQDVNVEVVSLKSPTQGKTKQEPYYKARNRSK